MDDRTTFKCKKCGKSLDAGVNEVTPECCGIQMEKLPYCTTTDTAEHARARDESGPCDDGRAG
ncbi:MAG: hypothetical protein V1874_04455 [Spirochaetota bacterium]